MAELRRAGAELAAERTVDHYFYALTEDGARARRCHAARRAASRPAQSAAAPRTRTTGRSATAPSLEQRRYPRRGPKQGTSADTPARGHAPVRSLRGGFPRPTGGAPPTLRLPTARPRPMPAP